MFKDDLINNIQKIFNFIENDRCNNYILRIKDDNIYNFINKIYYDNYREKYYNVNEIINNYYETIIFNCYNYYIKIKIDNSFVSIYVNDNKIITFNNCNIKKIILIDCNLINNKLNLDIKNCDNLKNIIFFKY